MTKYIQKAFPYVNARPCDCFTRSNAPPLGQSKAPPHRAALGILTADHTLTHGHAWVYPTSLPPGGGHRHHHRHKLHHRRRLLLSAPAPVFACRSVRPSEPPWKRSHGRRRPAARNSHGRRHRHGAGAGAVTTGAAAGRSVRSIPAPGHAGLPARCDSAGSAGVMQRARIGDPEITQGKYVN